MSAWTCVGPILAIVMLSRLVSSQMHPRVCRNFPQVQAQAASEAPGQSAHPQQEAAGHTRTAGADSRQGRFPQLHNRLQAGSTAEHTRTSQLDWNFTAAAAPG